MNLGAPLARIFLPLCLCASVVQIFLRAFVSSWPIFLRVLRGSAWTMPRDALGAAA